MTMAICYELGKIEDDIAHWTPTDVYRWHAFFRLKNEAEARALKRARTNASGGTIIHE